MTRRRRSTYDQVQRDLYLTQRTMLDYKALKRGRLGKRLIRRSLVRAIFRGLR